MTARKSPAVLGAFLLKRGLWLICVEVFVISPAFTFTPLGLAQFGGLTLVPLQTIWAIGASMSVLAGLQFLGARACFALGAVIVPATACSTRSGRRAGSGSVACTWPGCWSWRSSTLSAAGSPPSSRGAPIGG